MDASRVARSRGAPFLAPLFSLVVALSGAPATAAPPEAAEDLIAVVEDAERPIGVTKTAVQALGDRGDPRAVPIGVYAKSYLESLNLWKAVSPKVVPTENVRAALAAVEAGNADASIVYRTDAAISKKVKVAFEVPSREGPKISYSMAMVKGARELRAAEKFLAHLNSEDAAKVFRKFSFIVVDPPKGP